MHQTFRVVEAIGTLPDPDALDVVHSLKQGLLDVGMCTINLQLRRSESTKAHCSPRRPQILPSSTPVLAACVSACMMCDCAAAELSACETTLR